LWRRFFNEDRKGGEEKEGEKGEVSRVTEIVKSGKPAGEPYYWEEKVTGGGMGGGKGDREKKGGEHRKGLSGDSSTCPKGHWEKEPDRWGGDLCTKSGVGLEERVGGKKVTWGGTTCDCPHLGGGETNLGR